jgi:hypothetical protein
MNNTIKSTFTFGILLVTVGIIGHYFNWSQANVLILLGIIFEMYAVLVFTWKKIKGKQ